MPFCFSPWTNINITSTGKISPCCQIKMPDLFNVSDTSLNEYLSSDYLQTLKNKFLSDEKPKECSRCWKTEKNGIKSKRIMDREKWNDEYNNVDLNTQKILTLGLGIGNVCNLKCRICSSKSSSKWINEEEFYTGIRGNISDFFKNSSFVSQIKNISRDIIQIEITGGEPFVTGKKEHLSILDTLIKTKQSDKITLHYATNFSLFPNEVFWERWAHFKHVDIQCSMDGIKEHFEYNRYPADWNTCYVNLKKYQEKSALNNNIQMSIAHVLSVFTVFYLPEFYKWCICEGLPKPWVGRLEHPIHYQPGIFPNNSKKFVKNKLDNDPAQDVKKWANDVFLHDASEHLSEFWKWTEIMDKYRKQNFNKTFPEIAELLHLT